MGMGREQLTKPMDQRKGDPAYTSEGKATRVRVKSPEREGKVPERKGDALSGYRAGREGVGKDGWRCFGSQAEEAELWPREEDELCKETHMQSHRFRRFFQGETESRLEGARGGWGRVKQVGSGTLENTVRNSCWALGGRRKGTVNMARFQRSGLGTGLQEREMVGIMPKTGRRGPQRKKEKPRGYQA